ncbi:hypothetical protein [Roseomonas haemaphysalidis]|uniref:Uncharacterized protein n=1 Tax=Roseomonas haemaphysalidis TaxID=2768162 RepID=A0ABS3KWL5_9PROT|nr:hypothetical protein [Roseomonas haemaphysalidis]MBO1081829.1 hypothetical protein [Roseomonas haemaphysalidis]
MKVKNLSQRVYHLWGAILQPGTEVTLSSFETARPTMLAFLDAPVAAGELQRTEVVA